MMQNQRGVFYGNMRGEPIGNHGGYYPMDLPRG